MIDNEKTLERFGYLADSLSQYSHKRIVVICDYGGEEFYPKKLKVTRGRLNCKVSKDCCYNCRDIKREECSDIKKRIIKINKGINDNQKWCCGCDVIKNKTEFLISKNRKDKLQVMCNSCRAQYRKDHQKERQEKAKIYQQNNKEEITRKKREYLQTHVEARIKAALRGRIRSIVNKKHVKKSARTIELLGCTLDFFLKHLESQFTGIITWENYGLRGWHIDHIIPCDHFNLELPEEQKRCFHWTNLRPLWWRDNLVKYTKLPDKLKFLKLK